MLQYGPLSETNPEAGLTRGDRTFAFLRIFRVVWLRLRLLAGVVLGNVRLTHALQGAWRDRYARLRRDMAEADAVLQPSQQWTIISLFYRLTLRAKGLDGIKSTFGRFLSTYEPENRWLFEAVHHLYRESLARRDEWGLLDSLEEPELGSGTWIPYRGRRLSLDLLQSVDELYSMREALGFERDDAVVFCELGAGYGRLADVVLRAMPRATYMIFDLPESLLLSQYYLTTLHPDAKASLYPESASVVRDAGAVRAHRLVFGLPHQMRLVPPGAVDAFVNIYSFMEMGRPQIEEYFRILDGMAPRAVYLKQHKREPNIYDSSLNTGENYPIRPGWRQAFHRTSRLFEHVFEAAYLTGGSPAPRTQRPSASS